MKELVKSFFKKNPALKIKSKELAKKLFIKSEHEYSQLKHVLRELIEEGFLVRVGKRFNINLIGSNRIIGTLSVSRDADYGFIRVKDSPYKDIFVISKNMGTAFDGDLVAVSLFAKKRGKNIEGEITDIVQRKREEIVGTLSKTEAYYFVLPDEPEIHRDIYIPSKFLRGAEVGDKVVAGEIFWESRLLNPEGKIKEILGKAGSYEAEISAIAREMNLSYKFPAGVLKEAEKISTDIPAEEINRRLDLRNELIFTIDPDTAKDFDDAVSINKMSDGNFEIGIHIADVSHFVRPQTKIYEEALKRGTSVYFVGSVIPMLPEALSNKICSLVPNEDRLTFSVIVKMNPDGKLLSYEIKKSVINSKRRFTYKEVQEILDKAEGELYEQITQLNKIAHALRKNRMKKGSINFITPEVEFKLDDNGVPLSIEVKEIKESHNLIEELMLLANQIVAKHLTGRRTKKSVPFVYRVHDVPDEKKLKEFTSFVKSLGYSFDPFQNSTTKQFQKLLDEVKGKEEEAVVNEIAIRSMAKAVYSTENIGHYGLGFNYYTHFTSPIRRFPDLIVHQIIFNYLQTGENFYTTEKLEEICEHSSAMERTAISAERLAVKIKQLEFMKNKIGEEFHGVISGITNFGMFIEINENLSEGLIRLRDLDDDYYIYDEKNYSLLGRSTKKRYRLGDKVHVRVVRVDEEKREIDFVLLS
ncbi:MAG: ribonuclease R [bacterium]